jgi:hypothetical protein
MHTDSKLVLEMVVKVMVGKGLGVYEKMEGGYRSWSKDTSHRREAKVLGIFSNIWPERAAAGAASASSAAGVASASSAAGAASASSAAGAASASSAAGAASASSAGAGGSLPWRLTKEEIKILDKRMGRIVWPRYIDCLYYDGCSFWVKPGRMWKTRRKVVYAC